MLNFLKKSLILPSSEHGNEACCIVKEARQFLDDLKKCLLLQDCSLWNYLNQHGKQSGQILSKSIPINYSFVYSLIPSLFNQHNEVNVV